VEFSLCARREAREPCLPILTTTTRRTKDHTFLIRK
jgi:hypothetical protein